MKTIIQYFFMLLFVFVLSISAKAQMVGPSETRKQAETAIKAEQKREKGRKKREERVASQEITQLDQQSKYKDVVRKKERLLLKPVFVSKERRY